MIRLDWGVRQKHVKCHESLKTDEKRVDDREVYGHDPPKPLTCRHGYVKHHLVSIEELI